MNAIPTGGLTPEAPLTRSPAARRGAKPAASAETVSLMIELEDELGSAAGGAVMLDDADDDMVSPGQGSADREGRSQPAGFEDDAADSAEAEAARTGIMQSTGPDASSEAMQDMNPRSGSEQGGQGKQSPHQPDRQVPGAEPQQLSGTAGPEVHAAYEQRSATGATSEQGQSPAAGWSQGAGSPPQPDAFPGAGPARPAAARPAEASPQPASPEPDPWASGRSAPDTGGRSAQDTSARSAAEASARNAPETRARGTAEGWDRPAPPPRPSPRAGALPAASFGMPAQLTSIEVTLSVEIGSHRLTLRDLLSVEPGQLVPLDRMTSEPVDILVNGKAFARGEVVAIGDRFGVRLTELVDGNDAG